MVAESVSLRFRSEVPKSGYSEIPKSVYGSGSEVPKFRNSEIPKSGVRNSDVRGPKFRRQGSEIPKSVYCSGSEIPKSRSEIPPVPICHTSH